MTQINHIEVSKVAYAMHIAFYRVIVKLVDNRIDLNSGRCIREELDDNDGVIISQELVSSIFQDI